jgi:adenine-specific DNA-methyltransferase
MKVRMNTDLLTGGLKKARPSNESYWLMGQPDVELRGSVPGGFRPGTGYQLWQFR